MDWNVNGLCFFYSCSLSRLGRGVGGGNLLASSHSREEDGERAVSVTCK